MRLYVADVSLQALLASRDPKSSWPKGIALQRHPMKKSATRLLQQVRRRCRRVVVDAPALMRSRPSPFWLAPSVIRMCVGHTADRIALSDTGSGTAPHPAGDAPAIWP